MKQFCYLVMAAAFASALFAQAARQPEAPPADTFNLPLEKIGRDDLLGISVYDAPELSHSVRVSADGTIRLPMLKERLSVVGLYPNEVEKVIAEALAKANLLVDPIVTVSVVEYRSRPISVVGAVRNPLTFQATGIVTLIDAISRSGGLAENAGPEILVSQDQPGEGAALVQRIPVALLMKGANPELNLKLQGGEEIRIPDAGRVYVVGNVKKPGSYPIQDASESSVLKALALSEGLESFASKTAYIYRTEGTSTAARNEIPISLKEIITRKSPDVPLFANDILYIPDNTAQRKTMGALEKGLLIGTGLSGALIYTLLR